MTLGGSSTKWGSMAAEFQWTSGELFDCPRDGKPGGLVWVQKGESVGALGPEYRVLGNGERVFLSCPAPSGGLV
jgi:hypothetical protein